MFIHGVYNGMFWYINNIYFLNTSWVQGSLLGTGYNREYDIGCFPYYPTPSNIWHSWSLLIIFFSWVSNTCTLFFLLLLGLFLSLVLALLSVPDFWFSEWQNLLGLNWGCLSSLLLSNNPIHSLALNTINILMIHLHVFEFFSKSEDKTQIIDGQNYTWVCFGKLHSSRPSYLPFILQNR